MFSTVDIPDFVKNHQARRGPVVDVVARKLPTKKPQVTAHVCGHTSVGGGFGDCMPLDARRDLMLVAAVFTGMFLGSLIW